MLSIKEVIKNKPDYRILINAVIRRIGKDSIKDVNNHGIDGGFHGFIYYNDTHKFAMRYRKYIIELLEEMAYSLGEDVITLIKSFGVFKRNGIDKKELKNLYRYLGDSKCEQDTVTNALAWFAAEEVCRMFDN